MVDETVDSMLLEMLQDEKISQEQYLRITGRKFSNIGRILPRSAVRDLLAMRREVERMRGKPDDDPMPGAA